MEARRFEEIAVHGEESQSALRDLNNANARETSFLTETDWAGLVAEAFAAICVSDAAAFLITFQQNANYHSPNFKWFQERRNRFVYVDRIVVDDSQRGRGLGRISIASCSTGPALWDTSASFVRSISSPRTRAQMPFIQKWVS